MYELWEIELKFVPVPRRVRALDFTKLALKASVHHPLRVERGDLSDIAIVLVDGGKQNRKRVAVLEAHAAPVTDLEDALDLFVERVLVPILRLGGVVAQPLGGQVRDLLLGLVGHADESRGSGKVVEKRLKATGV